MPAHCDTLVRKIMEDIKISNKKFKAGNIASCLGNGKKLLLTNGYQALAWQILSLKI